jgi:indolepyruvate ferredoxin oxidoreductase
MLGYAYQKGWVPVAAASLERAIELNGVAVDFNIKSFDWGRRAAVDLERVRRIAMPASVTSISQHLSRNLDELVERREKFLVGYQNESYARHYRQLVDRVRSVEKEKTGSTKLTEAVARYHAKLLAYKDEYEVARLHSDGAMRSKIEGMFEGDYKVIYHLAPPLLAKTDPLTGEPKKMRFGSWTMGLFKILARLKGLRGGAFDPFGYTQERKTERALIREYEETVERLLASLTPQNHAVAIQIASLPEDIRGYGHIKLKSVTAARKKRDELLAAFAAPKKQKEAA